MPNNSGGYISRYSVMERERKCHQTNLLYNFGVSCRRLSTELNYLSLFDVVQMGISCFTIIPRNFARVCEKNLDRSRDDRRNNRLRQVIAWQWVVAYVACSTKFPTPRIVRTRRPFLYITHARSVCDANRSASGFDVRPEDRVDSINRRPIVQRNGSGTIVRP